jgi:hypothetical protein
MKRAREPEEQISRKKPRQNNITTLSVSVPHAVLEFYNQNKHLKRMILRMWAPQWNLKINFVDYCKNSVVEGVKPAGRSKNPSSALPKAYLSMLPIFKQKRKKEHVCISFTDCGLFTEVDNKMAKHLPLPIYWKELKKKVNEFWGRSEWTHYFTHEIQGSKGESVTNRQIRSNILRPICQIGSNILRPICQIGSNLSRLALPFSVGHFCLPVL